MLTLLPARRRRSSAATELSVRSLMEAVRLREQRLADAPDSELGTRADELRSRLMTGHRSRSHRASSHRESNNARQASPAIDRDVLVDAIALVCAAATRVLGITFYDVQILAGLALIDGSVAEMQTGEGKTFAAAFPAFVNSLSGRGVHVATSNEYLATRDQALLAPVYECLNATCGVVHQKLSLRQKQAAYSCDIVYGCGSEFGFDYLRDQVVLRQKPDHRLGEDFLSRLRGTFNPAAAVMQRGLIVSVVDEVDHVLLDDACSPLLLSEGVNRPAEDTLVHLAARDLACTLVEGVDYRADRSTGALSITDAGHDRIWEGAEAMPLDDLRRPWTAYIEQALRAKNFFQKDTHYVIRGGQVVIVDQSTGRLFEERTWKDGLHQAIEAREHLVVTAEKEAIARITRQRFYRLYERLSGMTGTATGSEREFLDVYGLRIRLIPTHRPSIRQLLPPRFFVSEQAKWATIARDVQKRHAAGQPVLIGTRSISRSLNLAERLHSIGVPYQILNGLQDADEAQIIAEAGKTGAVTIATNMAGRGTDIQPDEEALKRGGLHVLATEHHDSSRVDRQLIGRSARQGNVGSAQFFVSADDELIMSHGGWLSENIRQRQSRTGEISADLSRHVHRVQSQVEREQYQMRRHLFLQEIQRDAMMKKLGGEA